MVNRRKKVLNDGFSLIEILIVMVVTGLVVASVYSLFIHSQRTAYTSEEVVDVQQNLRVAVDTLVADIRMANFLLIDGDSAIVNAPATICIIDPDDPDGCVSGDFFVLRSSTSMKSFARVVSVDSPTALTVEVGMGDNFRPLDQVAVINPVTALVKKSTEDDGLYTIGVNAAGQLTLNTTGIDERDIIVRKLSGEDDIALIRYWLRRTPGGGENNFELMRQDVSNDDDEDGSVIATNIPDIPDITEPLEPGLRFRYLNQEGAELVPPFNPAEIRAIGMVITGQTDRTRTGHDNYSGVKNRSLETVAKLRNAYGE